MKMKLADKKIKPADKKMDAAKPDKMGKKGGMAKPFGKKDKK